MRKHKLLTYGLLAGAGYLLYKHMQSTAAPAVVVPAAAAATPAVSGFGRLGYFPSGADRPFARMSMPGANLPFARASHNVRWW
jgi:hypothetical protein